MQTAELVAGGELNARVAKAMGWRRIRAEPWQCLNYSPEHNHNRDHWAWIKPGDSDDTKWHGNEPPEYSTDISAAFQALNGWSVTLSHAESLDWHCHVMRLDRTIGGRVLGDGDAATAAMAICKALLAAVNSI